MGVFSRCLWGADLNSLLDAIAIDSIALSFICCHVNSLFQELQADGSWERKTNPCLVRDSASVRRKCANPKMCSVLSNGLRVLSEIADCFSC